MRCTTTMRAAAGALGAVVVLASGCVGHKSVHAELVIPASPDRVWEVLTDTSDYAAWNPIFVSVEGEFAEGQTLLYGMKNPEGEVADVEPEIVKLVPEREINQFGGVPGILTFDHTWRLEPMDESTRVTQHEEYRGIYVWFWDPSWVEDAYEASLLGLRDEVAKRR